MDSGLALWLAWLFGRLVLDRMAVRCLAALLLMLGSESHRMSACPQANDMGLAARLARLGGCWMFDRAGGLLLFGGLTYRRFAMSEFSAHHDDSGQRTMA